MELLLLGIILLMLGMMLLIFAGKARGGALILIGPIPILIGNSRNALKILFVLTLVLLIMVIWWSL